MATATKPREAISDETLRDIMALAKGADSIELKLTVPDTETRSTILKLGMDPLHAQIRQVFFYDTPDLTLNASGVVVRSRRVQNKRGDTVVKLRPVVPDDLPEDIRRLPDMGVEVDAMPGGYVCSASLKGVCGIDDPREVMFGGRPIRKLFSKEQRAFYAEHAPEGLALDGLAILGPIFVLKLKETPEGFGRPLVVELWLYPDGSRILELSTKCLPTETFQVAAESRMWLLDKGIDLSGEQQTKTKKALEFFVQELKSSATTEKTPAHT